VNTCLLTPAFQSWQALLILAFCHHVETSGPQPSHNGWLRQKQKASSAKLCQPIILSPIQSLSIGAILVRRLWFLIRHPHPAVVPVLSRSVMYRCMTGRQRLGLLHFRHWSMRRIRHCESSLYFPQWRNLNSIKRLPIPLCCVSHTCRDRFVWVCGCPNHQCHHLGVR
jgi:hypothetical protein